MYRLPAESFATRSGLPSPVMSFCSAVPAGGGGVVVVPIWVVRVAAVPRLPARSVARTLNVWVPLTWASQVLGLVHAVNAALAGASAHSNVAVASLLEKLNVGVLSALGLEGNGETIVVVGAAVSTVTRMVPDVANPSGSVVLATCAFTVC